MGQISVHSAKGISACRVWRVLDLWRKSLIVAEVSTALDLACHSPKNFADHWLRELELYDLTTFSL